MFATTRKLINRAALVLAATATLGACDSDGTGPGDGHEEAAGLVVVDGATTVVSINAARQVTGSLTVRAGQSRHLDVFFVSEDGDRFQIDEDDDEHSVTLRVANSTVATVESHGDHVDLVGRAAGNTTVVFSIMHGNHSDYDSPSIPIVVTP